MAQKLVRLGNRPSRDGTQYTCYLDYLDETGKRRRQSLGHSDKRKAERQRDQLERKLRMGWVEPGSLKLSEFVKDSLTRTGDMIRESSREAYAGVMKDFIKEIGDIDFRSITLAHGERYRQICLDRGNSPATVGKKLQHIKTLFNLAVKRQQIEVNPLRFLQKPRCSLKTIKVYTKDHCLSILRAARDYVAARPREDVLRWDLMIAVCFSTAMRRGELLNLTWADIDFDQRIAMVRQKRDTATTWKWFVKDSEERKLPLTDQVIHLLTAHYTTAPEGNPYVFIPINRYRRILQHRKEGKWDLVRTRERLIGNYWRKYDRILEEAKVPKLKFHALRATALSIWLANGMGEFDVMNLAGHSDFRTTHKYYLAIKDDLVPRAREVTAKSGCLDLAHIWHAPLSGKEDR